MKILYIMLCFSGFFQSPPNSLQNQCTHIQYLHMYVCLYVCIRRSALNCMKINTQMCAKNLPHQLQVQVSNERREESSNTSLNMANSSRPRHSLISNGCQSGLVPETRSPILVPSQLTSFTLTPFSTANITTIISRVLLNTRAKNGGIRAARAASVSSLLTSCYH